MSLKLSDYDYSFPAQLIAQAPLDKRSASRMMVLQGQKSKHDYFKNLTHYLKPGDLLIFNETQVLPARLHAKRKTGGQVEVFLLKNLKKGEWRVLFSPAKRLKEGEVLSLYSRFTEAGEEIHIKVTSLKENQFTILFANKAEEEKALTHFGEMPLPPYIRRKKPKLEDQTRYQTVFAKSPGAVAAPTAALHFDEEVLKKLEQKGVERAMLTLHVGAGTFAPVKSEVVDEHEMHEEYYKIPATTIQAIQDCHKRGSRLIAVGTTSLRALETYAASKKSKGWTEIFIRPGYEFKLVKNLLTNFHQPKSTLLMLVSALVGRDRLLKAYEEAIQQKYRLFSYGDSMLILD